MKKILSILGAIGLSSTVAIPVVSCGNLNLKNTEKENNNFLNLNDKTNMINPLTENRQDLKDIILQKELGIYFDELPTSQDLLEIINAINVLNLTEADVTVTFNKNLGFNKVKITANPDSDKYTGSADAFFYFLKKLNKIIITTDLGAFYRTPIKQEILERINLLNATNIETSDVEIQINANDAIVKGDVNKMRYIGAVMVTFRVVQKNY